MKERSIRTITRCKPISQSGSRAFFRNTIRRRWAEEEIMADDLPRGS